ncbi:Aste57867_23276 [Aphanomyces stellatus]|uniref:Aste57867_23276 protein n=1 Tax=Aphanomyces stellatus TaxID=120398 RepID=A0A485LNC1_9STRA|nr:hypothetical protein As57867_023205 [Aphanomyces stellatus]VFT99921.1 Aste57867_23276 [Aphanomyces stellatus]
METVEPLTRLCLQAVARNIIHFFNSRLLDSTDSMLHYRAFFHPFDVSVVERLREDGEFKSIVLAALSTKALAPWVRYGELLFEDKRPLDPNDLDRFGLDFTMRSSKGGCAVAAMPVASDSSPLEVDLTFDGSPRQLTFTSDTNCDEPLGVLIKRDVPLTNFGAHAIADLMFRVDTIQCLSLVSCRIGTAGVVLLAMAVAKSRTLRLLDVSNDWAVSHRSSYANCVGDGGAMALAAALRANTSLQKVVLSGNPIGFVGGKALAEGIRCNSTLQTLHLKQTRVRAAAKTLIQAFEDTPTLLDLDLEYCRLPPGMGSYLAQARHVRATAPRNAQPPFMATTYIT